MQHSPRVERASSWASDMHWRQLRPAQKAQPAIPTVCTPVEPVLQSWRHATTKDSSAQLTWIKHGFPFPRGAAAVAAVLECRFPCREFSHNMCLNIKATGSLL